MSRPRHPSEIGPTRRDVLCAAGALPIALACTRSDRDAPGVRARNLLVVLADDMSWCDLGCSGNPDVRTPQLDRFAEGGLRFERAYTVVGVCQPSRSSLLTGLNPIRHGALGFGPIAAGVATWPQLLREAGVATALIGKLDVDPIEQFPFDYLVKAKDMPSRRDPQAFADQLRAFLGTLGERRFAAVLSLHDPHRPFDEEAPPVPTLDPARLRVPPFLWDTPETRLELAQYYDCVARLDRAFGLALAELEAAGRGDDTLVIFTSDNGMAFPFAKATLYEAGVRMPLLVRGPGVRAGVSNELVTLDDLLPTALELFGAPPRALDGTSLLPLLGGERGPGRAAVVTMQTENNREQGTPSRALHERRFKYIRNFRSDQASVSNVVGHTSTWRSGGELARNDAKVEARMRSFLYRPPEELFDLAGDPWELLDLAPDPAYAAELARMRAALHAWMQAQGDPLLAEWDG